MRLWTPAELVRGKIFTASKGLAHTGNNAPFNAKTGLYRLWFYWNLPWSGATHRSEKPWFSEHSWIAPAPLEARKNMDLKQSTLSVQGGKSSVWFIHTEPHTYSYRFM